MGKVVFTTHLTPNAWFKNPKHPEANHKIVKQQIVFAPMLANSFQNAVPKSSPHRLKSEPGRQCLPSWAHKCPSIARMTPKLAATSIPIHMFWAHEHLQKFTFCFGLLLSNIWRFLFRGLGSPWASSWVAFGFAGSGRARGRFFVISVRSPLVHRTWPIRFCSNAEWANGLGPIYAPRVVFRNGH